MKKSEDTLLKFASQAGSSIWGLASVPDDWINQLKTYRKIIFEDAEVALIYVMTLALYVELLAARTDDLLEEHEQILVEKKVLESILEIFKVVYFDSLKDIEEADNKAGLIKKLITDVINSSKEEQGKNSSTVPEIYTGFFVDSPTFGKKVPKSIWIEYVNSKIELFEEQNFRKKLENQLNALKGR